MGNHISFRPSNATGKIVHYDGSVQQFNQPLTVAELMLEHPQQVVVEFHSTMNQNKPIPLPADKNLEMKKIYIMLPLKQGKPVGLHHILFIVNSSLNSKYLISSSGFLPWLARLCHNSTIFEDDKVLKRKERMENREERCDFSEYIEEMIEERPEYLSRQLSGKGWKPSLDTIKEKKMKKKLSHWFFSHKFLQV
ncbi:hypothetical protein TanjilG_33065 [Lupinus angustifolius]|uniref:Uncharacterized protein n=1 Tax=Lupinus angustifolius TaxID=3871 RepID=A0A1J7HKV4_LUPAN|nr:PREDICTED: uncharacterized protein LOC109344843 [Lupinus angustifolius]OIW13416.1 hypothetical protein TanjilG_33065 [Lupinus angustifolius]